MASQLKNKKRCALCQEPTTVICNECPEDYNFFCDGCKTMFHLHKNRGKHTQFRPFIESNQMPSLSLVHELQNDSILEKTKELISPEIECEVCGEAKPDLVHCPDCESYFCIDNCDVNYHKRADRRNHKRFPVNNDKLITSADNEKVSTESYNERTNNSYEPDLKIKTSMPHLSYESKLFGNVTEDTDNIFKTDLSGVNYDHSDIFNDAVQKLPTSTGTKPKKPLIGDKRREEHVSDAPPGNNDNNVDIQRKARRYMAYKKVSTFEQGEMVARLVTMGFNEDDALAEAGQGHSLNTSVMNLGRKHAKCNLCTKLYPLQEMTTAMMHCSHSFCTDCALKHFRNTVRNEYILNMRCPECQISHLITLDAPSIRSYIVWMKKFLRDLLEKEDYNIFLSKITKWEETNKPVSISTETVEMSTNGKNCDVCKKANYASVRCQKCEKNYCKNCDDVYHTSKYQTEHIRTLLHDNQRERKQQYSYQEINIAKRIAKDEDPVSWLENNWELIIVKLFQNVSQYVDHLEYTTVKEVLIKHHGNVSQAYDELKTNSKPKHTLSTDYSSTSSADKYEKMANKKGYSSTELKVAMRVTDNGRKEDPIQWLENNWNNLMIKLTTEANAKVDTHEVDYKDAMEVLQNYDGNYESALRELNRKIKSKSTKTDITKKVSNDGSSSFKMAANLHNRPYSYPASNSTSDTSETQMQEFPKSRQPVNDQDIASNIVLPHTYDYDTKQDARTDRSLKNDENKQHLEQLASSVPIDGIKDKSIEETARNYFDHNEHNLTYEKAVLYAELLSMGYNETQAVISAKVSEDMVHAISNIPDIMICSFCQNEVENTEDLVVLLRCVHRCCKNCAVNYFTVQIQEKSLSIVCPLCKEPSIFGNESVADQYFTDLSSLLQRLLLPDMYGLFVKKLKYRKMEQDPNFFSCGFCFEGFIAKPKFSKITCSNCKKIVCATCKIEWEQEHERMTCEEFMNWRSEKSMKANEIVRILNSSELHCPSCRCLQYQTTFGRTILHFRCISCGYQFCRMCGAQFLAETVGTGFWNAFWSTFTGGTNGNLVISHYRNCFHLLFPKPTGQLQFLLKSTGIPIVQDCADTTPTRRAMKQRGSSHDDKPFEKCPVLIKQEVYGCLATIQCSNVIYEDDCSCGVCSVHYKEYLLHLIIWNKIEPLEILTNREMETILKAAGKKIPKIYFMNAQYTTALAEKIRKKVPLYVGHTTPDESESSEMRTPTSSGKNKKEQNSKRGNGKNQPSTNQGRARWV